MNTAPRITIIVESYIIGRFFVYSAYFSNIRVQVDKYKQWQQKKCIFVLKFCYIFLVIHVYDGLVYKKGTLICTVSPAELSWQDY